MNHLTSTLVLAALIPFASACGDDIAAEDAGVNADAAPIDAGVRALCPVDTNATCVSSETCGTPGSMPPMCPFCPRYNPALCALGCHTPPLLLTGDTQTVSFVAQGLGAVPESFGSVVLAAETAGGRYLTCQDIYDDVQRGFISEPCVNVLDSRWTDAQREGADTYRVSFSRFASELPVLFVVYAFATNRAEGIPIGVSCTARTVGAPGSGPVMIPGDSMKPIQ